MTDAYVLYYPPTTGFPFLVVSFPADGAIEVKPFATEEEAETFMAKETVCGVPWNRAVSTRQD
jgi:hypothetical protein